MDDLVHRASAEASKGRHEAALRLYRKALESTQPVEVYASAADSAIVVWRLETAKDILENALRIYPGLPEQHYQLGFLYFQEVRYGEAARHFEEARRLDPNLLKARVALVSTYWASGDTALAVQQLLMLPQGAYDVRLEAAHLHTAEGRKSEAMAIYDELAEQAHDVDALAALAKAYIAIDEFDRAAKVLERAHRDNPGDYAVITEMVEVDLRRGDPNRALERISASGLDYLWYYKGWAEYALGQYGRALVTLEPAMDAENGHAISILGWVAFRTKKFDVAVRAFSKLVRMHPGDRRAERNLFRAALRQRNWRLLARVLFAPRSLGRVEDNQGF